MRLSDIAAWLDNALTRYWYVMLLALGTFEAFTSKVIVLWFGEPAAWVMLSALVVATLYALLAKPDDNNADESTD